MKTFHNFVRSSIVWQREYGKTRYHHVDIHLCLYLWAKYKEEHELGPDE